MTEGIRAVAWQYNHRETDNKSDLLPGLASPNTGSPADAMTNGAQASYLVNGCFSHTHTH